MCLLEQRGAASSQHVLHNGEQPPHDVYHAMAKRLCHKTHNTRHVDGEVRHGMGGSVLYLKHGVEGGLGLLHRDNTGRPHEVDAVVHVAHTYAHRPTQRICYRHIHATHEHTHDSYSYYKEQIRA